MKRDWLSVTGKCSFLISRYFIIDLTGSSCGSSSITLSSWASPVQHEVDHHAHRDARLRDTHPFLVLLDVLEIFVGVIRAVPRVLRLMHQYIGDLART